MTNQMRVEVFNGNARAVMVFPVYVMGEYNGRMIFIENSKERVWTEAEITFAKQITEIISRDLGVQIRKTQVNEVDGGLADRSVWLSLFLIWLWSEACMVVSIICK